jgi:hypothetical protein
MLRADLQRFKRGRVAARESMRSPSCRLSAAVRIRSGQDSLMAVIFSMPASFSTIGGVKSTPVNRGLL